MSQRLNSYSSVLKNRLLFQLAKLNDHSSSLSRLSVSFCCCRESIHDEEAEKIAFDVYKEVSAAEKSKHKLLRTKLSKSKTAAGKKEVQASQT